VERKGMPDATGVAAAPVAAEATVAGPDQGVTDLKVRTVRGALASTVAQGAALVLRTGSMIVLSRLLLPRDFGVVAMATAATGFLALFRDFGLSTASVQRGTITQDQVSALFWINLGAGVVLAAACVLMAPGLVRFYGEPRLYAILVALGMGFVFNGATAQHRAMLQRQMRFQVLAVIDTAGLTLAIAVSIALALLGYGYWAVVSMTVCPQFVAMIGTWSTSRWMPGPLRRHSGLLPLLKFGSTLTLNSFVIYLAYNLDKILLGRVWGAEALGLYSRAYQLMTLPTDSLSAAISPVALRALSTVQTDPVRRRRFFLQGYGTFLTIAIPVAVACAAFGGDIIVSFLGAKWIPAITVFRILSPTMLAFAVINPFSWLMLADARPGRSLAMATVIAPTVILGYSLGLHAGPVGVATGFSVAMLALIVPLAFWAMHGLGVSVRDLAEEGVPVVAAALVGALTGWTIVHTFGLTLPWLRLVVEGFAMVMVFAGILLGVRGVGHYAELIRHSGVRPMAGRTPIG
jgi:PST family polysaccharide transporter